MPKPDDAVTFSTFWGSIKGANYHLRILETPMAIVAIGFLPGMWTPAGARGLSLPQTVLALCIGLVPFFGIYFLWSLAARRQAGAFARERSATASVPVPGPTRGGVFGRRLSTGNLAAMASIFGSGAISTSALAFLGADGEWRAVRHTLAALGVAFPWLWVAGYLIDAVLRAFGSLGE